MYDQGERHVMVECIGNLVHWKGYSDPSWIDEADLNCGAMLEEFERNRISRNRFEVMQSHEEESCE